MCSATFSKKKKKLERTHNFSSLIFPQFDIKRFVNENILMRKTKRVEINIKSN